MVAETIELPNIRKLFVPDEGCIIYDADLERADAQVVAWDAGDEGLKEIFRAGLDIHTENAKAVYGADEPTYEQRQKTKSGVHAVNYVVTARTLAQTLGTLEGEAQDFIDRWLGAHPDISRWHRRIDRQVKTTRQVRNVYGYRMYFFDRVETLLPKALAWIPQSTVAIATNRGLLNIYENMPDIQLLLQVHDNLIMQGPIEKAVENGKKIKEYTEVVVPYDDPLTIPVSISASPTSWGDAADCVLVEDTFLMKDAYEKRGEEIQVDWL